MEHRPAILKALPKSYNIYVDGSEVLKVSYAARVGNNIEA